jgi:hypothetical protein
VDAGNELVVDGGAVEVGTSDRRDRVRQAARGLPPVDVTLVDGDTAWVACGADEAPRMEASVEAPACAVLYVLGAVESSISVWIVTIDVNHLSMLVAFIRDQSGISVTSARPN